MLDAYIMLLIMFLSVGKYFLLITLPLVFIYKFKPTRKIIDKYIEFY